MGRWGCGTLRGLQSGPEPQHSLTSRDHRPDGQFDLSVVRGVGSSTVVPGSVGSHRPVIWKIPVRIDSLVKSLCRPLLNTRTHAWVRYTVSVPYASPTYCSAQMCYNAGTSSKRVVTRESSMGVSPQVRRAKCLARASLMRGLLPENRVRTTKHVRCSRTASHGMRNERDALLC